MRRVNLWICTDGTPSARSWHRSVHLSNLIPWAKSVSSYLCRIQANCSGSVACLDSASTPVFVAQEKCSSVAFCAISHKSRMWKYLKGERNCSNCNFFAKILLAKPNLQNSKLLFQSVGFVKHATEGYPAKILSKMHSTPMLIMTDQTFQVCDLHALNRFWAEQELPLATLWLIHAYLGI